MTVRCENHHQNREGHIRSARHAAHPATNYQLRARPPDFASALGAAWTRSVLAD
jgi:hypothetical protein